MVIVKNWMHRYKLIQLFNKNNFHITHMYQKTLHFNIAICFQLLEMPYEGNDTSLVVILPKKIDGIDDLVQKLSDSAALNKALDNMYVQEVNVYLPRFKIETTTNLKQVLENVSTSVRNFVYLFIS